MNKAALLALGILWAVTCGAYDGGDEVLARRGQGEVTHLEFDARMQKIPAEDRAPFLRDGKRLEALLAQMLLSEQLAAEAKAAGFADDDVMQARMHLAAQSELADAWLEHHIASQPPGDYEAMAREDYALNSSRYVTRPAIDVSHILIATENRGESAAERLAREVLARLREDPSRFDELVLEYSEDPSMPGNKGHFRNARKGEMVKPFEDAAFALQPGEISEPVQTQFGFHIIRLNGVLEPRVLAFEEVRPRLEEQAKARHRQRIREEYLKRFTGLEVDMTDAGVRKMLLRYFAPEALADLEGAESQ